MIRPLLLAALALVAVAPPAGAAPATYVERKAAGLDVGVVTVDLADPATQVELLTPMATEKEFWSMVGRAHAAAVINAPAIGISAGRAGKPAATGTSFGLLPGNVAQLRTARWDPPVDFARAWTAVTGGPRLLRDGKPWLHPEVEPLARAPLALPRSALGLSKDGKQLYLVTFPTPVTLLQAATAMQALGAWQALNLDGGPTRALAVEGEVLADPGHAKAGNVLAVYDARHPVPRDLRLAYLDFGRPGLAPLAAGKVLTYAGLPFTAVAGTPIVASANDTLAFGARSFGPIFAPWRKQRESFVLNFDARVVDEGWTCYFDGANEAGKLVGASLECRLVEPRGLYLRQDGKVIGQVTADVPLDDAWHRYHCQVDPDEIKIYGEDTSKPLITGPRGTPGTGLGFAGRGEFRRFTLKG
ncbi:MAG: hypothetical protein JWM80_2445 [Cyanobacteria bacterium RYN_339]|nr:hypothetical protein [Cyanobacteria bacterium RYN_339]